MSTVNSMLNRLTVGTNLPVMGSGTKVLRAFMKVTKELGMYLL